MTVVEKANQYSIRPHNAGPSAVWSSGGAAYDEVSRGILDAIEHAINRLAPSQAHTRPGNRHRMDRATTGRTRL